MNFSLNQIFEGTYPPEAAEFCNANGYVMQEVEKQDGKRRFQIQSIPAPTQEELFASLRSERGARLAETDFRMLPDVPGDTAAWLSYRQALRDLPAQPGAPWDGGGEQTPWPAEPK